MKNRNFAYYYTLGIAIIFLSIFAIGIGGKNPVGLKNKAVFQRNKQDCEWGEKDVYLTFDDAPGDKVTEEVLDILKEKKVMGTFFVVGERISGREDIIKRISTEGHSIGLHSYSHKMKKIYSSPSAFIDEMEKTSDEVFKVNGVRTKIIRFPGGSKPFMTNDFLDKLHEQNFKIYDWNVPVSDGINAKLSPDKFYSEATNTRCFKSPLIILMHCSGENENTVKALPDIIEYYKELGYDFKALTSDCPEYYFKVKRN